MTPLARIARLSAAFLGFNVARGDWVRPVGEAVIWWPLRAARPTSSTTINAKTRRTRTDDLYVAQALRPATLTAINAELAEPAEPADHEDTGHGVWHVRPDRTGEKLCAACGNTRIREEANHQE